MYIGVEAEGELRGMLTLFITDKTQDDILQLLEKYPEIQHVYFGARGRYGLSSNHVPLVEEVCKRGKFVTIETNMLDELPTLSYHENLRIVLAIKVKDASVINKLNVYVKVEDASDLFVFCNHLHTRLNDLLYTFDREVS